VTPIYLPLRDDDPILKTRDLDQEQPGVWWRGMILADTSYPYVYFDQYCLVRETPKGRWVKQVSAWNDPKELWKTKGSRFMSTTKRQALVQLLIRKRAHVRHAKRRYENAELGKRLVQDLVFRLAPEKEQEHG
jgi:hypothetical protein